MTYAQIARLTDHQISSILTKEDQPDSENTTEIKGGYSAQEVYYLTWKNRGWKDEDVVSKWKKDYPSDPPLTMEYIQEFNKKRKSV